MACFHVTHHSTWLYGGLHGWVDMMAFSFPFLLNANEEISKLQSTKKGKVDTREF